MEKPKMVTIWEPRCDVDGGGRMSRGMGVYYLSQTDAGKVSVANWGGEPRRRTAIEAGGELYILDSPTPIKLQDVLDDDAKEEIRKKALDKLSPAEREALGLKEQK